MATTPKTVIVTGASQGIGAAIANLFIDLGYNVVANSRNISAKNELRRSDNLALVDGDISHVATAERIIVKALERFGTVDVLVNNAGVFSVKHFTQYTADEFRAMCPTNLEGFLYPTHSGSNQPAGAGSAVRSPGGRLTRRPINCASFLICADLIAYALHAQFDLGLDPCPLCIFQHIGIAALGVAFLIAALGHLPWLHGLHRERKRRLDLSRGRVLQKLVTSLGDSALASSLAR